MTEIWLPVDGFAGYEVSNRGRVRHVVRGACGFTLDSKGYPRISLSLNGVRVKRRLHRLVAIAFLPNPDGLPQVDHVDTNKLNADVRNLEWVTNRENMDRAIANDLVARGSRRATAKLTESQAAEIRAKRSQGVSVAVLSIRYGIAKQNVYRLLNGKSWAHVA